MDNQELEAIVAAILSGGAAPADNTEPRDVVQDYRRVLKELQDSGGLLDLQQPDEKGDVH